MGSGSGDGACTSAEGVLFDLDRPGVLPPHTVAVLLLYGTVRIQIGPASSAAMTTTSTTTTTTTEEGGALEVGAVAGSVRCVDGIPRLIPVDAAPLHAFVEAARGAEGTIWKEGGEAAAGAGAGAAASRLAVYPGSVLLPVLSPEAIQNLHAMARLERRLDNQRTEAAAAAAAAENVALPTSGNFI